MQSFDTFTAHMLPFAKATAAVRRWRRVTACAALVAGLCLASLAQPARAEIETARDLMDAGDYQAAMVELLPAARSGNAEAEELIGVMYALGLGVEQDDIRAFEWYLRASLKGHAGAQSGIGWYYEVGRGMPAPDLVRAYTWYVLSAIGGDPDAAMSQEEVVKKMTREEIEKANILIEDYRVWLYPFR
jgi:TPR repeat protein